MRIVFDTDVLVAAMRSDRGASRALVELALDRELHLQLSVPLCIEYEAVLTRKEHLEAIGLTVKEVNEFIDALVVVSHRVHFWYHWRPASSDANDEMVLETAINGAAEALVTFNVKHLKSAAGEFGIRVVTPREFLAMFRRRENAEE